MAIHRDLTAAELHEPINIISAGTVDAGKVLTPSATTAGESVLRNLDNSEVLNTVADFGNMVVTNNSTVQALTAATDSTFNTNTDYAATTAGLWAGDLNVNGITFASGLLTVTKAGVYSLTGFMSVKSSVANTRLAVKFVVNGTVFSTRKVTNEVATVNAETVIGGSGLTTLAVNDTLQMFIVADKNCNITLEDANIILTMVRNDT